jgi:hypothetical protein
MRSSSSTVAAGVALPAALDTAALSLLALTAALAKLFASSKHGSSRQQQLADFLLGSLAGIYMCWRLVSLWWWWWCRSPEQRSVIGCHAAFASHHLVYVAVIETINGFEQPDDFMDSWHLPGQAPCKARQQGC